MGKSLWISATLFTLSTLLTGCVGAQPGKPIIAYERDSHTVPKMSTVSDKGLYVLFPGDGVTPLEAVYLHPGDQFGFQNQDGKIVGVYTQSGETKTTPLDGVLTSEYVWKYQGDKQP